jgi:hypothetical protein
VIVYHNHSLPRPDLRTKFSIQYFHYGIIFAVVGFLLSTNSIAADISSGTNNQVQTEAISNIDSDSLSETAVTALEKINNEVEDVPSKPDIKVSSNQTTTGYLIGPIKNPYSQLVNLAFKGKGVNGVRNYEEAAIQYCHDARDFNDANAEFALGWLYVNGRGVEKNEDIAALFFTKAAQQGHTSAKNWLASSKGNPALAKAPQCMSPDPVVSTTRNSDSANQAESDITPFYTKGPIYKLVAKIAPRFKIDTDLAMAFIAVESGFNPKATSPKNAQGLMQLIPETATRFKVKNAYDPEENIKGGLAYLQWLLAYFEGDVQLVAAAYNSGENTVDKYKGIPPYPETKKYVKKIASLYKKSFHPYREDLNTGKSFAASKVSS